MVDHTCQNCYAAARLRLAAPSHPSIVSDGPRTFWAKDWVPRYGEKKFDLPLEEKDPCVIFAFSHADLFHPLVADRLRDRAFNVMARVPHCQFNLLTKRVEAMQKFISGWVDRHEAPLSNLRIGLSAGTQEHLNKRWPLLRDTPAAMRHLSLQPLIEAVRLPDGATPENLAWVVIMREIGPGARPMQATWVRELREQCDERGIPFFWEATSVDGRECVAERRRAAEAGRPYAVQPYVLHSRR